jgi:hypothetical protein
MTRKGSFPSIKRVVVSGKKYVPFIRMAETSDRFDNLELMRLKEMASGFSDEEIKSAYYDCNKDFHDALMHLQNPEMYRCNGSIRKMSDTTESFKRRTEMNEDDDWNSSQMLKELEKLKHTLEKEQLERTLERNLANISKLRKDQEIKSLKSNTILTKRDVIDIILSHKSKLTQSSSSEVDGVTCSICLNNMRDVLYMPCRHVCACLTCTEKLLQSKKLNCPICRTRIAYYIPITISRAESKL